MSVTEQELNDFRAQVSAWMTDNKPANPDFLLPQTFMEVGSEEQLEFLRQHGLDVVQGYLYSPPLPPLEFEQFYHNHSGNTAS